MRILHLTRDYPPLSKGGISTAVGGMVSALVRYGVTCAVISFDNWRPRAHVRADAVDPRVDQQGGVQILRLDAPAQLSSAERFGRQVAPTHLHVHHEMLWPFARKLCSWLDSATLFTLHVLQSKLDELRSVTRPTLSSTAQREALQQADRVLVPSQLVGQLLLERDASLALRLQTVGLGIEDTAAARTSAARRAVAQPHGLTDKPRLLYAGRFADVNGTAELFELIERLTRCLPDLHFTIAGGVPGNPRSERRWQRRWQRSASAAATERTTFTGWVGPQQLAELYDAATVVVSPSWFETFGLSVLEAMLHGLPIAATRSGGVEQLVRDGETGLLSAVGHVGQLADNVARLVGDPALARQLGAAAADSARSNWLWALQLPQLLEAYEAAARRCSSSRRSCHPTSSD